MNKGKIIRIIDYLINGGIYLIIFLIPLFFSFYFRDYSGLALNFSLEKIATLRFIVEILAILCFLKLLIAKELTIYLNKKHFLVVAAFFLLLIIATIFSVDPYHSFYGSYWRQQGLFTQLHYLFFFIILAFNLRKKEQIERLLTVALISSFLVSLLGIIEWLGFDYFFWSGQITFGNRVSSTIGQPTFLGNYLILLIFLSSYKIFANKKFISRLMFCLILLFQLICLALTYSRGSWVGLTSGFIFAALLYFYLKQRKIFKISIAVFSIFIILLSYFVIANPVFFRPPDSEKELSFIYRIQSIFYFNSGSNAMRLKYWQAGLKTVWKRPIFGYGPENQQTALMPYYQADWLIYEDISSYPDRSHNELLDILLISGVFGLAAFILLIIFVFIKAIRKLKNNASHNKLLIFFLLAGLAAYLAALQFSFSLTETNIYFWLYLAILFLIINDFTAQKFFDLTKIKKIYYAVFIYAAILAPGYLLYATKENVNAVWADYYFRQTRINLRQRNYQAMYDNFAKAINLNNKEEFYQDFYAIDLMNSFNPGKDDNYKEKVLSYLRDIYDNDIKRSDNYQRLMRRASILKTFGQYQDKRYFNESEKIYLQLIASNPDIPDTYKDWVSLYVIAGEPEKAIAVYQKLFKIMPDLSDKYLNQDHKTKINNFLAVINKNLGQLYCEIKDFKNCLNSYEAVLKINPYQPDIYKLMADIYYEQGDLNKAIWYNQRGLMLNPNDFSWHFSLAILFKEKGLKDKAMAEAEIALKLNPESEIIPNFIGQLK